MASTYLSSNHDQEFCGRFLLLYVMSHLRPPICDAQAGTGYDDMADESPEDKWADSNAPIIPKSGDPDGALVIVAETGPLVGSRTLAQGNGTPRLRVMRAEMAEGTLVKETSEATVLERLQRDLRALEDGRGRR